MQYLRKTAGVFAQLADALRAKNFEVSTAMRVQAYIYQFGFMFLYTLVLLNYILSILIDSYTRLRPVFKQVAELQKREFQHLTVRPSTVMPPCTSQ